MPDRRWLARHSFVTAIVPGLIVDLKIRSCEDLLALTRELKEIWLLGALNTLQKGKNEKAEEDAEAVVKLVQELINT